MVRQNEMMSVEDVQEILAVKLLGIVPEDETIITTANKGELAVMTETSRAGQAFRNIGRRLRGETVPFPSFEEANGNFLGGIFKKLREMVTK